MKLATAVCFAAFAAVAFAATAERQYQRIVGGSLTTISQYPYGVALLHNWQSGNTYWQSCGGTILTNFVILSASHCFVTNTGVLHTPNWWRARVGSNFANSGGVVHNINLIRNHPNYNRNTDDSDVSLLRTATSIVYNNNVAAASIAGTNYNLADNQQVWAIGWGDTTQDGSPSEQLRHVQIWTVNQATCNQRYSGSITSNMMCSGWLDVGGRDQCQGDSGGPLIHNGVIVGVCSWGAGCAQPYYPGVNARVSTLSNWIVTNANSL